MIAVHVVPYQSAGEMCG